MKKIDKVMWQETIYPILVLSIIALIVSAALAVTNMYTAPVIEANEKAATLVAYVEVLPSVSDAADLETVDYTADGIDGVVIAPDGSVGVKVLVAGYDGGVITIIVGFDTDGTVSGIWADALTQTQGFGTKVAEDSYLSTFLGLDGTQQAVAGENGVDLIAGVTVSSSAFISGYNLCVDTYNAVSGSAN
ncbi:MAG: FMN-binding protein [Faecalibacterium sp.]